jgi:hypothetical protein
MRSIKENVEAKTTMALAAVCAFLSSILAGYAALDLLPPTVAGRTAAFAVWLITLYPADRLMAATRQRPWWHHWVGSAVGVAVVWAGYTLTTTGAITERMSLILSFIVGIVLVGSLFYYFLKARRHHPD